MNSHEGRYVVVTVQPGYELVGESSPTHIGGELMDRCMKKIPLSH